MKSFNDLIKEAKTIRSKEDAEKMRQEKDNPDEWAVRNKGGGHHALNRKSSLKGQQKRRSKSLKPLRQDEFRDYAKRNLIPDSEGLSKKAIELERSEKRAQRKDAQTKSKESGEQYDVDHIQGQPNRRREDLRQRFQAIHPGDASANREVIKQSDNLRKNSKNVSGSMMTRSKAIATIINKVREQGKQAALNAGTGNAAVSKMIKNSS